MSHRFDQLTIVLVLLLSAGCDRSDNASAGGADEVAQAPVDLADSQVIPELPDSLAGAGAAAAQGRADRAGDNASVEINGITASASAADGPDASGSAGPSPAEPGPSASAGGRQASSGRPETSEAPGAGGVAANDILDRAERAYAQLRSMEADFVQQVYVPLLERTIDSRGKIFHRAPDRFLMRFSEPAGDVVVADGRYVWMYYPSNDPIQVMRSPLTEGGQQADLQREFLSDATERYRATRTGSENVGGRQTHALTLVPRSASPYQEIRIWVDAQDSLVRRFEITEQNGSVRRLEMRNLRPNVPLGDDLFEFTPPPNAQVIEP